MLEGIFNYSPMLLKVHNMIHRGRNPFKYYRTWSTTLEFQGRA